MAVAVAQAPYLVLDRRYTVVEMNAAAATRLGPVLGRNIWTCHPEAEPLFRPRLDEAWHTRGPIAVVEFYEGRVLRVQAVRRGGRLELSWDVVMQLDTVTLEGLNSSIAVAIEALEDEERAVMPRNPHRGLRLVGEPRPGTDVRPPTSDSPRRTHRVTRRPGAS